MRIMVLTNEFHPQIIGGLGIVATELSAALAEEGTLRLTVITKGQGDTVQVQSIDNLKIIRFPSLPYTSPKIFFPKAIESWLDQTREDRPALLHVHSVQCCELALACKAKWQVPLVYTCHSLVFQEHASAGREEMVLRQALLFEHSDSIIVPSGWLLEEIVRKHPAYAQKIFVIPNGVTSPEVSFRPNRYHLLFVGRLVRSKGIEELLYAVSLLREQQPLVKLIVIGTGSERYLEHLYQLSEQLDLNDSISWLGFQMHNQVQQMYADVGAVIVPSRNESFCLVALEALAAGVPLVSTQCGGLVHLVDESVASIIPEVEPVSICEAVFKMWDDQACTDRRVRQGKELAAKFGWSQVAHRYRELFQSLLAGEGE
ncbi:glycosyltransferase family 4 protein [Tumebacillus lipolyticus]|uniref:Glycosyltransferase family 4 protein n=1 Tax=Tumebacillus lipolyticus TaxID=1280370 RepID=A0ABW4ZTE4_9BACL